jgi:hypothetical protein
VTSLFATAIAAAVAAVCALIATFAWRAVRKEVVAEKKKKVDRYLPKNSPEGRWLSTLHQEASELQPAHPPPWSPRIDEVDILDVAMSVDVAQFMRKPRELRGPQPKAYASQIWWAHGRTSFVLVSAHVPNLDGQKVTVHTVNARHTDYDCIVLSPKDVSLAIDGALDIPEDFGLLWDRLV